MLGYQIYNWMASPGVWTISTSMSFRIETDYGTYYSEDEKGGWSDGYSDAAANTIGAYLGEAAGGFSAGWTAGQLGSWGAGWAAGSVPYSPAAATFIGMVSGLVASPVGMMVAGAIGAY